MPMLSSLHVIGSRRLGGAESFFLRLVTALNQGDHHATAVVRPTSPLLVALQEVCEVHSVPMRNGWDVLSASALRKLVRRSGVDVVQTYMGRASRLVRVPKGSATRHVARLGGYYKIAGYYQHADAWVGNTQGICDYLVQQGLPAARVFHIGNFVDAPDQKSVAEAGEIRRKLGIPDSGRVIFALGRFVAKKGFDDLLQAFAQLPPGLAGRELHLVIAGDGPLRAALGRQATELGIADRTHWPGWVEQPGGYFQITDLFVIPSLEEPLGNVILEAWSHGLPVISTRTAGGEELIRHGETGCLVPCQDQAALGAVMGELLSSSDAALAGLGAAGLKAQQLQHSRPAVIKAYLDLYDELCR